MNAWRRECRRRGVSWGDVLTTARALRAVEIERREPFDGARRSAWRSYCHFTGRSPSCHPFWRVGFGHVLGRLANSGRDYTAIPQHDVIAASVGEEYPQWVSQTAELWDFLGSTYQPIPTLNSFFAEAIECLTPVSEVPF